MSSPMPQIAQALEKASRVLITAHHDPDGDALGAAYGLKHILQKRGARVSLRFSGIQAETYSFLPGWDPAGAADSWPEPQDIDLAVLLDCHEPQRIGPNGSQLLSGFQSILVVDHHEGEADFGQICWLNWHYAATCQMVAELALAYNWPLEQAAAVCLYTGILTDTGSFSHGNTSPACLRIAGDLVERGASPAVISREVFSTTANRLRLGARIMERLRIAAEGRLALAWVSLADLEDLSCTYADLDLLVEQMRSIRGVEVSLLLSERPGGRIKVSLRSRKLDVAALALSLGGGGHRHAAGASLSGDLAAVQVRMVSLLQAELERQA